MKYHTIADLGNAFRAFVGPFRPVDNPESRLFAFALSRISAANARAVNLRRPHGCNEPEAVGATTDEIVAAARAPDGADLTAAWATLRRLRDDCYGPAGADMLAATREFDLDSLVFMLGAVGDRCLDEAHSRLRWAA
jgi:hypothetical protein